MQQNLSSKLSFRQRLYFDWKWILIGSIFSFFYASALFSNWNFKTWFLPNLTYPYVYGGDVNLVSWEIQRVLEGGLFDNPRSGYPFGSIFLDYPHSDNGNFLILKLFGLLTGSYYGAINLYILTSFVIIFISSFYVFRAFSLRSIYAFGAALLFSFAPFHLSRILIHHLFYTWYFVVPLYFLFALKIFFNDQSIWPLNLKKLLLISLLFLILSSFGVYYAFFGIITLIIAGLASAIRNKHLKGLFASFILSGLLAAGVGINLLPNLIYIHKNGLNKEVGIREPKETEVYAFKIAPLFFPTWNHQIKKCRNTFNRYIRYFDFNETVYSSSLGLIGSLGLAALILCFFSAALGRQVDIHLVFLAILVFSFFLIASVGGLNVIFALYVSPLIRGWNRISIFISFAAIASFFVILQGSKKLDSLYSNNKLIFYSILSLTLAVGLFDQTPSVQATLDSAKKSFVENRHFIQQIEASLPAGSAIYQLPYRGFPEYGRFEELNDYELLNGVINSITLKWNHAGIKGREGDFFYRNLAKEPLSKQLEVIKRLGFSGIYIDRRGFHDKAKDLIRELNQLLGYKPDLISENRQIVFYRINPTASLVHENQSPKKIMEQAEYFVSMQG